MPTSEKPRPVSPSPFPRLTPVLSQLSRYQSPPPRDDGLDNFPAPLPHNQAELERQLTQHPEIERQMADDDVGPPPEGGKEAWACVMGAFFVLFCIFGFSESLLQGRVNESVGAESSDNVWAAAGVLSRPPAKRLLQI